MLKKGLPFDFVETIWCWFSQQVELLPACSSKITIFVFQSTARLLNKVNWNHTWKSTTCEYASSFRRRNSELRQPARFDAATFNYPRSLRLVSVEVKLRAPIFPTCVLLLAIETEVYREAFGHLTKYFRPRRPLWNPEIVKQFALDWFLWVYAVHQVGTEQLSCSKQLRVCKTSTSFIEFYCHWIGKDISFTFKGNHKKVLRCTHTWLPF